MPVLEGIELLPHHPDGVFHGRCALLVFQLEQQAFLQVPGAHAGGFEFLNDLQEFFHFFGR